MKKLARVALVLALALVVATPVWSQSASQPANQSAATAAPDRSLWIAKFSCEPKAAGAVASIQQSDAAALQYSSLFKSVTSFSSDSTQPPGSWSLAGKEISYAGGSAAERVMVGWGTGRAHVVMDYELRDPQGKVVWANKIKSEPSFWSSSGTVGGVQSQHAAVDKQSEKLIDTLTKFFATHK